MSSPRPQKLLIVLLAAASVCTTALVAVSALARRHADGRQAQWASQQGGAAGATWTEQDPDAPPVLGAAPDFTLIERSERTVTDDDLRGRVWIANFIYSTCPGPCPMMTSQMARLQGELQQHPRWDDIRLVSFSVDPEKDTPERLREYARLAHADPQRWLFLTGTREQLWSLANQGFKLYVGEAEGGGDGRSASGPVVHAQKFVLVDAAGRIRGYYDGLEDEERTRLRRDLELVLNEMGA